MPEEQFNSRLADYAHKYEHIKLTRRDGVLELRMHTQGGSLKWASLPHLELGHCFAEIANDPDNAVVILTGTGNAFCAEVDAGGFDPVTPVNFAKLYDAGRRLLHNLLEIPVPVIGAVNGPARIHAELALMSNIVLASDDAVLQDGVHFTIGAVPGDGVHVAWPAFVSPARASYFLLTGQTLDAQAALAFGLVNEVLPRASLMDRAWALAEEIARRPARLRRHTRTLLIHELKRRLHEQLSNGIALEGLAMLEAFEVPNGR